MSSMINTNIASLNAQRNLNTSQVNLATSLQRLSSGLRINSAKDDAAGMAISERMTSQIRGLNQAARNANDAISLSQTAEGALDNITNNLQRIRELTVQSANATNSSSDRATINAEAQSLVAEIDRVAKTTSFNGKNLLDGTFTAQNFQVGADANQTIAVTMANARTNQLGAYASVQSTVNDASRTLGTATLNSTTLAATSTMGTTDLVINGVSVGAPVADGVSYQGAVPGTTAQSAIAIANAINSTLSGATAKADANVVDLGNVVGATLVGDTDLLINGVGIVHGSYQGGTNTDITTAINAQQNQTGVVASFNAGGHLILTAADGRNITLAKTGTTGTSSMFTGAILGAATAASVGASGTVAKVFGAGTTASHVTFRSTVTMSEGSAITLSTGGGLLSHIGLTAKAGFNDVGAGTSIGGISLATDTLSQTSLTSIDSALSAVNNARAALGAYQNRFMSTVANLQATSENLSASRSRIQDADFAAETANLTRGQIMQQAGTAMLAQANSIPNGVMALLR